MKDIADIYRKLERMEDVRVVGYAKAETRRLDAIFLNRYRHTDVGFPCCRVSWATSSN